MQVEGVLLHGGAVLPRWHPIVAVERVGGQVLSRAGGGGGGGRGCSEASSRRVKQRKPAAGVQQRDWFMINYACFWSAATAERRRRADPPAGTTAAALSSLPCSPHLQHQFDHLPPLQRHQVRASNWVDGRRVGPVGGGEEHLHLAALAHLHMHTCGESHQHGKSCVSGAVSTACVALPEMRAPC